MSEQHFNVRVGGLVAFISVIIGLAWWYPTTIGGSAGIGNAADPRLLLAISLGLAACLLRADHVTSRIRTTETITNPTPKTVLIWNLAMIGMTGVFWWIATPFQFGGGTYLCSFCFGSIGFVTLFVYIATMNTMITWHALLNVRHMIRRDYANAGLAAILPAFSFLFVFWFGVYDSWEGWHLRLYWDGYQKVIRMDSEQLDDLSPGWLWEPIPGDPGSPKLLPKNYQHLAKDGFSQFDDEVFFFSWYDGPSNSRGLMYSTRLDYCQIPNSYITADWICIEIRPNWYRFAVW